MSETAEPQLLPCVEIEPSGPADAAVIWMHGLGANGHDFEPIVPYLGLPAGHGVRFVFPHAPSIPVTINMGMVMPAWYDISQMNAMRHDEDGLPLGIQLTARWDRDETLFAWGRGIEETLSHE